MSQNSTILQGGLSGAGTGAAIGTVLLPGVGTAVGAGIGGIVGAGAGYLMGDENLSEDEKKARAAALAEINSIKAPELQKMAFEHYVQQGLFQPEEERKVAEASDAMAKVQSDPRLKAAQMEVLQNMKERGMMGLTATDRLALAEVENKAKRDFMSNQGAVLQNRQMRGLAGSGDELAASLAGGQAAAESERMAGMQRAAQAQQAALAAMGQYGGLASQMRTQGFGEDSAKAQAANEVNRFNTTNQIALNQRNVAGRNQAQMYNLGVKQDIANKNVGLGNEQQMFNNYTIPQQQFQNESGIKQARANAQLGQAGVLGQQQAAQNQTNAQLFGSAAQTGLAGAQMYNQQQKDQAYIDYLKSHTDVPNPTPTTALSNIPRK